MFLFENWRMYTDSRLLQELLIRIILSLYYYFLRYTVIKSLKQKLLLFIVMCYSYFKLIRFFFNQN